MSTYNPACYLPKALNAHLPNAVACPPPPVLSFFQSAYTMAVTPFSSTYTILRTMFNGMVSLPFLSFLLLPTMTSYSTSLNLLFFYLTWSTLILSHPPQRVEMVATLAVRVLFYVIPSGIFLAFDVLIPSAAVNLKAMGESGLPFNDAKKARLLRKLRVLGWSFFNTMLFVMAQSAFESLLTNVFSMRSGLKISTTLPLPWAIAKDLLRGYFLREVLTYIIHRYTLHESSSRNPLHHYHKTWYHSLKSPFPFSATYDHPAAYLVRSFLPTFLPALIFHFHLLTYILYLSLISLEETWAYSGYSRIPGNFVLGGIARRANHHLISGGDGNFGCCGLVDWVMDTSIGNDLIDDVEMDVEEHDLVRRAGVVGKRAKERVVRRRIAPRASNGGVVNGTMSPEDEDEGTATGIANGVRKVLRRSARRRDSSG